MASENFDTYNLRAASPPRQQVGYKKPWGKIRMTVRETRKSITRMTTTIPSFFLFNSTYADDGSGNLSRLQFYFLGDLDMSRDSTLLKVDIPDYPLGTVPANDPEEDKLEDFSQLPGASYAGASYVNQPREPPHSSTQEAVYNVTPVFSTYPMPSKGTVLMSKEEQLLRERKRLGTSGITSYESDLREGVIVIPAHNSLYVAYDNTTAPCIPTEIPTSCTGARLDPKLCPANSDLLAFVNEKDIWLSCLQSGREIRLTHTSKGESRLEDNPVSAGVPSFVIQEEFDRYTGYWWAPACKHRADGKKVYHILYEEVDESAVEIVSLFSPSPTGNDETYRYPRAGTKNANSSLRLLELTISYSASNQVTDVQVADFGMRQALFNACPWAEYLTRAGWTADGNYVYAVVLDRLQMRQAVMLISPSSFYDFEGKGTTLPHIQCIYEETSNIWINVSDILHFFPQVSESQITFLISTEKSGFRHIHYVTSLLQGSGGQIGHHIGQGDPAGSYTVCEVKTEIAVTSGPWVVFPKDIWVDDRRGLVFFMATVDSPLESHLYVTSYRQPRTPVRLTEGGFSHSSVQLNENMTWFVSVYSSLEQPPQCAVFKLLYPPEGSVKSLRMGQLTRKLDTRDYEPPTLFQYPSRAGHQAYGLYFLPRRVEKGRRYPTVLFVYGGPCVQMVTNSFKGQKFLRLHTLAAEGYAVVVIDGRGSTNRGLAFEGILKNQMGTVEIDDQVEGLLWLASQTSFIDMSRVAIYGWSYGGYLSLMGVLQRPDIFKTAVAGAPVVSWELYDTGYTERYIGLPQVNKDAYKAGSVLSYVNALPDHETKILLVHSLKDENVHFHHSSALINQLVKFCKPYQLQTYPNERHGIRDNESNEHYKTTVLKFLQDYLL